VLDASAASEIPWPAEAMKKPMSPAPVATRVVTQARLRKVRIVVFLSIFDWLLLSCSCDFASLSFEQNG
jgi:hypothetical protein